MCALEYKKNPRAKERELDVNRKRETVILKAGLGLFETWFLSGELLLSVGDVLPPARISMSSKRRLQKESHL